MKLAKMTDNSDLCKTLFLAALPSSLSTSCTNLAHTCKTVEELTKLAINISNTWESKNNMLRFTRLEQTKTNLADKSQEYFKPESSNSPSVNADSIKKRPFCFYCKSREHSIDTCPKRKSKVASSVSVKTTTASCTLPATTNGEASSISVLTAVCQTFPNSKEYPNPGN